MKKLSAVLLLFMMAFVCTGCGGISAQTGPAPLPSGAPEAFITEPAARPGTEEPGYAPEEFCEQSDAAEEAEMENSLRMLIDDTEVTVDWEDNESAGALKELAKEGPLTIRMNMYGGFEQVGPLGTDLPRNDRQTTAQTGDIMLYSGNQIVVFYGSNAWAYTRLGRISDKSAAELEKLLGNGDVTMTLSWEQQEEK